jgi:peptidoglycan hydrolase-like protein with peptidoglycan-binding domain
MLAEMRVLLGMGESPAGSNHNRLTDWYADRHGAEYRYTAWCDIAVSYAAAVSGNSGAVMGDFAWTVAHAQAFQSAGRWVAGAAGARSGDVIFFDWGGTRTISRIDHVGVVEAAHSDGTLTTIEGNTEDRMMRRRRSASVIAGYGRPAYDGTPVPSPVRLAVDGEFGPLTCAALQRALNSHGAGLVVDGVYGPLTKRALQRHLGVTADGAIGPITVRALQRRVGASVDGAWGPQTTRALQQRLNAGAF